MALTSVIVILLTSLLALPLSYVLNIAAHGKDQVRIFICGMFVLLLIALLPQYVIRKRTKTPNSNVNSFIHVLSLLSFNSVMSLIGALENDGLIAEFMGSYLREGQPYLKSAHGTMICYWDGICHNAMYLTMMAALSWNQSFCDIGLYWAGSFGHFLMVLFISVIISKDYFRLAFLLYSPFMVVCIWAAKKFIIEKADEMKKLQDQSSEQGENHIQSSIPSIWKRPADLCFLIFYVLSSVVTIFRFSAAMGTENPVTNYYIEKIEPYLDDTLPFSKAEMMVQLFYFVPYYVASIYALLYPGQSWVPQWSILYAGSVGQGQFSFIGSSLHYRTPYIYRVPQTSLARSAFWSINAVLFIMPQIIAFKYNTYTDYFLWSPREKKEENKNVSAPDKVIHRRLFKKFN